MSMQKRFVMLLPLLAAACNAGPTVTAENASVAEVTNKVAALGGGGFISPGHWDSKVTITQFDMPGMDKLPPAMAKQMQERMKEQMSRSHESGSCVTEADVKSPKAGMFGGDQSCRYDHFKMGGGIIDAAATCDVEGGKKRSMTIKGSYSADSYRAEVSMTGGGMGAMAMTLDARRAGACTGKETG